MRTEKVEIVTGNIGSTGIPGSGPLTSKRVSAGIYEMYPPPGKRIASMMITGISPAPQWSIVAVEPTTYGCRAIIANATGAANVDSPFQYSAALVS